MPKQDVPGAVWRLLAHEEEGPVEITNRGLFDELVVDSWFHMEKMDSHRWWLRLGDADVRVEIGATGDVRVDIERGAYAEVSGTTSTFEPPE